MDLNIPPGTPVYFIPDAGDSEEEICEKLQSQTGDRHGYGLPIELALPKMLYIIEQNWEKGHLKHVI